MPVYRTGNIKHHEVSLIWSCVFTGTRVGIQYEIMLLMTGSGLCFRKAAYQQFVAGGERLCSQR